MRAVVVSLDHEILVELFRHRPALGRELLRACAGIALRGATAEKGSIDLSQVAPPSTGPIRWSSFATGTAR